MTYSSSAAPAALLLAAADQLEIHAPDLVAALRAAARALDEDRDRGLASPEMHTVHLLLAAVFTELFLFLEALPDADLPSAPISVETRSPRFTRVQHLVAVLSLLGVEDLDPTPQGPSARTLLRQARDLFDELERLLDPTFGVTWGFQRWERDDEPPH
jgi:hypothetical protein